MVIDIILDERQKHVSHILALRCRDGLEPVVQLKRNIQIHSFYLGFFDLADASHPLSIQG